MKRGKWVGADTWEFDGLDYLARLLEAEHPLGGLRLTPKA